MPLACPTCGSRFLRESEPRTSEEKRLKWRFKAPLRCLDCKNRFIGSTLIIADFRYARCPRCYRMDLNGWTGKTYEPPFWMGLKITLGAYRWRCEYCRINFASFRQRRETFTFKRWANLKAGTAKAEGRARMNDREAREEGRMLVADLTRNPPEIPVEKKEDGEPV